MWAEAGSVENKITKIKPAGYSSEISGSTLDSKKGVLETSQIKKKRNVSIIEMMKKNKKRLKLNLLESPLELLYLQEVHFSMTIKSQISFAAWMANQQG